MESIFAWAYTLIELEWSDNPGNEVPAAWVIGV
jgi:hypothetical protein